MDWNENNHRCNGRPVARRLCEPACDHGPTGRGGKELRYRKPPAREGQEFQQQHDYYDRAAAADASPNGGGPVQDLGWELTPVTAFPRMSFHGELARNELGHVVRVVAPSIARVAPL